MKRIMYIECKKDGLTGEGRIGWVEFSRSMRSFYYAGKRLQKTRSGYKYNCVDVETGDNYWISGPKRNGMDRLYGGTVEIDDDARVEYWTTVRHAPELSDVTTYRS